MGRELTPRVAWPASMLVAALFGCAASRPTSVPVKPSAERAPIPTAVIPATVLTTPVPSDSPQRPPPVATWAVKDAQRVGSEIALGRDGSVYVVGGQFARRALRYQDLWVARYRAGGQRRWERNVTYPRGVLTRLSSSSIGLSIAVGEAGDATVVNTNFTNGAMATLRRFSAAGAPIGAWKLMPGIRLLRSGRAGELIAAGWDLIQWRLWPGPAYGATPFTSTWIGTLAGKAISWRHATIGSDGSRSGVWDLAVAADGSYVAAGKLGTAADSDAGDVWVGRGTTGQEWSWNALILTNAANLSVSAVPDGGVLVAVAGRDLHHYVAQFDETGRFQWARALPAKPNVALALKDGYLVGYAGVADDGIGLVGAFAPAGAYLPMRLELRSWDHALIWELVEPECESVQDLASHDALFVLKRCDNGFGLARYDLGQAE